MSDTIEISDDKLLTPEECAELATAMGNKYAVSMQGRRFTIRIEKTEDVISVQVLLANDDQSFYYPVEARMLYKVEELTANRAAIFLVDYIDLYFEEFLMEEDEELFLPIDWADHEWDTVNFQIKGQIFNRKVEAMADALLQMDLKNDSQDLLV